MRVSKGLAILLVLGTIALTASTLVTFRNLPPTMDLSMRYNESLCSHTGLNPFHVWNGDVYSERFKGLSRPDIQMDVDGNKLTVHAYPPWHTAFTWFYGSLPYPYVVGIVFFFYGVALFALFNYLKSCSHKGDPLLFWSWIALALIPHCIGCMAAGNYGIVCAGLLLAMIFLLNSDKQILAGLCWALMMIKPQMATLLVFPLAFQKKFKTITVAVVVCLTATLWTAYAYGESPIALILQVPQIGAPYETNGILSKVLPSALARMAKVMWVTICVGLCAWLSWGWRSAKIPMLRYAPVAFIFPFWMYSQAHDRVASWPMAVFIALLIPKLAVRKKLGCFVVVYAGLFAFKNIYVGSWRALDSLGVALPNTFNALYSGVNYPIALLHFLACTVALIAGRAFVDERSSTLIM